MRRSIGIGLVIVALIWTASIVPDTPEEARGDRKSGQLLICAGVLIAGLGATLLPNRPAKS